jgi:superfamily II DNA or RNA helicase
MIDPMSEASPILSLLDEQSLGLSFDSATIARARAYVAQGRVQWVEVSHADRGQVRVEAEVQGADPEPYAVDAVVVRSARSVLVHGRCSCFVGSSCKHVVAAVLAAQEAEAVPVQDDWEKRLAGVLDELGRGAEDGPVRSLGLEVSIARPEAGDGRAPSWQVRAMRPTVRIRPVTPGKRGTWIHRGVGWDDLPRAAYTQSHDPAQLAALTELATARRSPNYYRAETPLDDLGAGVWAMLDRAVGAGVELVGVDEVTAVRLVREPLQLRVELRDGRLEVGVDHDDRWWSGDDLLVVGRQGHGAGLLDPATGALHLGPLDRVVPEPLRRLLESTDPLRVPEEQADRFVRDYLPRLRRHLPVRSTDRSVPVPEEVPPEPVLTVSWRGPGVAGIAWSWRYRLGATEVDYGFDEGYDDRRRADLERARLARLELGETGDRLLRDSSGALRPGHELRGDRLLELVAEVLPALRDDPRLDVVEVGVQPDYRPVEGDLDIRFEMASEPDEAAAGGAVDWLSLQVLLTIDGEQLPLTQVLEAFTRDQDHVFLPSGRYLPADHPALVRLADAVRAAAELVEQGEDGGLRVGRADLGLWGELAEIGLVDEQAARWVEAARALTGLHELPRVDPVGVVSDLRDYQLDGFRWLAFLHDAGLGGILADDMGLGKTLQTLALIAHARRRGAGPFLVVAPTSVVPGWVREAARHAPDLVVRSVTAGPRRRRESLAELAGGADVLVTSYTLLRLEAEEYVALPWGGLVLDEAQQVKNHQGKTYQAVRRIDAPFRLALTGTPFENRLMELWSLLSIVAPGLYPWPRKFAELVANPVEKQGDERALARFRTRIRPFLLRRTKERVAADLPPKQEQVLDVALGTHHRRVYDTHLQRERQHILGLIGDFDANRVAIFRSLTKLRQLSLDAALVDPEHETLGSAKIDVLVEHLQELAAEGHRALVFSQFTSFLARVRRRLDAEGIGHAYLDGSTRDRDAAIAAFREGDAPAFLISLKAGGVGLTLTEASYVFVLDPWWNPAAEAQAVDRAHRIGQHQPVMVYRMVSTDTVEEKVMELKARKAALFAQVVDGDGAMATAVTADDVRALLGD